MSTQLDIHPSGIQFGSVTTLLNGAISSLSGPVGFSLPQPKLRVKRIVIANPSTSAAVMFSLYKGASGAGAAGTQVLCGTCSALGSVNAEVDFILEANDFLTGECISTGSLVVNISADISF